MTERVSPRVFRVVAITAPTEREKSQMYVQRYVPHFPSADEIVIFDRSWYNRAGVEHCPSSKHLEQRAARFSGEPPLLVDVKRRSFDRASADIRLSVI